MTPAAPAPAPAPNRRLTGYLVLSGVYLALTLVGLPLATALLKPLLMPALALAFVPRRAPGLLFGALLASCVGDTALLFGGAWFLVGMGGFAAAHVCYITLFTRGGALRPLTRRARFALGGYAVVWAALITLLWPDLPAGLRIPVACYSLLLAGTAATSLASGPPTGLPRKALGGALFLLSDSLIATGLAHWPQLPAADFWIMLTYLAGQYLLATGAADASGQSARSTTTGAWSEVPLPLRASRST
ncbi:lysoplasmalogenase [Streptacidiphilus melanogenes]|uniref:lysoplasmalogenase n=1 Tax=Streptacidiphilus melanogenes TaxID=411235 RepID=UPI0005A5E651|nr:lysoplasmalogenase [Streptacidiphilus melanogenes]